MKNYLFILTFILLSITSVSTKAVEIKAESNVIQLPTLDSLYKWAEQNNPTINFHNAVIERNIADEGRISKQWTDAIKFSGYMRVGSYGNTVINQVETGYSYGPSISLSLYEIMSHSNQMKVYKGETKAAGYKRDEAILELHKYIRLVYNSIILQQTLLKIKSEALNTSYVHLKLAEKEFNESVITLSELSRVNEIYTKSEIEYEMNVNDLKNAYMELQQVVGITLK